MSNLTRYDIVYTQTAEDDILSKAEYIEKVFHNSRLAYIWYQRLRDRIQNELSFLPEKYQIYDLPPWKDMGIRELIFRNDIVLYSVDKNHLRVIIHAVFTAGQNLSDDISE